LEETDKPEISLEDLQKDFNITGLEDGKIESSETEQVEEDYHVSQLPDNDEEMNGRVEMIMEEVEDA
jgi:hypothetical protein